MQHLISGAAELGLTLNQGQLDRFQTYYEELTDWNHRINLTSITGFKDVQLRHFLDSLTLVMAIERPGDARVIDVGAGAGLPGLPLKIILPGIKLVLLESKRKKAAFLSHLIDKLQLYKIDPKKIKQGKDG